jgi:hypothetical protein
MNIKKYIGIALGLLMIAGKSGAKYDDPDLAKNLQPAVFSLTMVMMHDVVNPPAASRYYAYVTLGALEIVAQNNKSICAPAKYISHFPDIKIAIPASAYDYQFSALYCILETGRLMLPSGFLVEKEIADLYKSYAQKIKNKKKLDNSITVARDVAAQIVKYSQTDNYNKLSTFPRYRPTNNEANWYPTPPAYMEAIEPHWDIMRTMIIDSAKQFIIDPPVPYDTAKSSEFYKIAYEVYDVTKNATAERIDIASFWDCNPFVVANSGHMSLGFKKITPGGHWMNITSILAEKVHLGFDQSAEALALQGITLYDAFICCWDEKYRSNRVRPETFINKYIDINWQPLLQTPPFPEYTSGHSVISTAGAELLTYLFGDSVSFHDDTELIFELAPRDFKSARLAAKEAAISRLYGGIHYIDAVRFGQKQGMEIGKYIVTKLKSAGVHPVVKGG